MYCKNCGADLPNGSNFCTFCGMEQTVANTTTQQPADPQSADRQPIRQNTEWQYTSASTAYTPSVSESQQRVPDRLPPQFRPLSAWAYFGYSLLYSIPLIGMIILFVNAFKDDNINRRNHARSLLFGMIFALIVAMAAFILAAVFDVSIMDEMEYYL